MGQYESVYLNDRYTNYHLRESGSTHVPFYYSLSAIQLKDIKATWSGKNLSMQFLADIPTDYRNLLNKQPIDTTQLYVAVMFDNKPVEYISTGYRINQLKADKAINDISFPMQLPQGYEGLKLSISSVIPGRLSVNSTNFKIR